MADTPLTEEETKELEGRRKFLEVAGGPGDMVVELYDESPLDVRRELEA